MTAEKLLALANHRSVCGFYSIGLSCPICAKLAHEAGEQGKAPSIEIVEGRPILTLTGLNELRLRVGLQPIKPEFGERFTEFRERVRRERDAFFRDHPELGNFSPIAAPCDRLVAEPSDGAAKSSEGDTKQTH